MIRIVSTFDEPVFRRMCRDLAHGVSRWAAAQTRMPGIYGN